MVLESDGYWWEDWDCTLAEVPVAPVCQRDTNTFVTTAMPETTSTAANVCDASWSEFDGGCYKHFTGNFHWIDALGTCNQYQSQPAIVHSKEEEDFLVSLSGGNDFWLGGTYTTGEATWIDGSPFDYGSFYNPVNSQCMYYYTKYDQFDTEDCVSTYDVYSFICEK